MKRHSKPGQKCLSLVKALGLWCDRWRVMRRRRVFGMASNVVGHVAVTIDAQPIHAQSTLPAMPKTLRRRIARHRSHQRPGAFTKDRHFWSGLLGRFINVFLAQLFPFRMIRCHPLIQRVCTAVNCLSLDHVAMHAPVNVLITEQLSFPFRSILFLFCITHRHE